MSGATSSYRTSSLALGSFCCQFRIRCRGQLLRTKAQKSHLNFQASIADINARIAELGAPTGATTRPAKVGRLTLGAGQLKAAACGLGCQWD